MAARAELVVYLEEPQIHIQIVDDKASERSLKLRLVIDVVGGHGNWNVALLENTLSTRLRAKDGHFLGLTAQYGQAQRDGELDVVVADFSRHYVRLPPLYQILQLPESLGTVEEGLA